MDFGYSPEQEELRREVLAFIRENVTPEVHDAMAEGHEGPGLFLGRTHDPVLLDLITKIHSRGWLGMAYPKEYGGQGGSRLSQYIVEEEFTRALVYIGMDGSGAPAILAAGTEEQKRHYIPKLISGEISFALGFTEPSAGADLAALQCRATRDGDHYVINGQKMYTSGAEASTHIYLMARTDPSEARHKGISIFLFPLDTPGVTIRPLWTIQNEPRAPGGTTYGMPRTNETFYDNVRIPASALLGKENEGWRVGAMGLNLDRVGAFRYLMSVRRDEDIVNFLKTSDFGGYRPAEDPAIRDRVAELWIEAQVCRLMTMRSMSIVERGGSFTYEGSAEKIWAPEHGVRTSESIAQMLGPYGQLLHGSPLAVEEGVFAHNLLGAFQSGVNHGSTQIMRDQVARRGLDMPRS